MMNVMEKNPVVFSGLVYDCTNETLEAIVKGLEVDERDKILAVGGSGDQAFALLEYAGEVKVVDYNPVQVRYIRRRVEYLKNKDFEKFLWVNYSKPVTKSLACIIKSRNEYFEDDERLDKIYEKIDSLKVQEGNIFYVAQTEKGYNKLYFSNASFNRKRDGFFSLKNIVENMPVGGLIYCAHGKFFENAILKYYNEMLPEELKIDEELTQKARKVQGEEFIWKPSVYRKMYKK